jgi:hypothetical protein
MSNNESTGKAQVSDREKQTVELKNQLSSSTTISGDEAFQKDFKNWLDVELKSIYEQMPKLVSEFNSGMKELVNETLLQLPADNTEVGEELSQFATTLDAQADAFITLNNKQKELFQELETTALLQAMLGNEPAEKKQSIQKIGNFLASLYEMSNTIEANKARFILIQGKAPASIDEAKMKSYLEGICKPLEKAINQQIAAHEILRDDLRNKSKSEIISNDSYRTPRLGNGSR